MGSCFFRQDVGRWQRRTAPNPFALGVAASFLSNAKANVGGEEEWPGCQHQAPPAPGDAGMGGLQVQQTGHRKDQIIHLQLRGTTEQLIKDPGFRLFPH